MKSMHHLKTGDFRQIVFGVALFELAMMALTRTDHKQGRRHNSASLVTSWQTNMRLFCSVACAALLCGSAVAFPTSTGSCDAGTDAILKPGFSHATNAQVGTGPLSDSGISVTLNDELLVPDTPTDFSTMEAYNLTIASNDTAFTGFLARIEGSGEDPFLDTTAALAPYDTQSQVAMGTCVIVNRVGGVSHTNADPKTFVSTELKMDSPAKGLLLDITVVIRNLNAQNVSEWYFSRFELNAIAPPSMAPTTRFPETPTATSDNGPNKAANGQEPTSAASVRAVGIMTAAAIVSFGAVIFMF